MKNSIAFLLSGIFVIFSLAGCSGDAGRSATESNGNTSLAKETTTASNTVTTDFQNSAAASQGTTATAQAPSSSSSAAETPPSAQILTPQEILKQTLGPVPNCDNPAESAGEARISTDGKWYIDDGVTVGENTILVNRKGAHSYAINIEQSLGDEWKVGAAFRPIKNHTGEDAETCTRMWIQNADGEDCFLFTVSYFQGCVAVTLEMWYKTTWLKLYTPQEWVATSSDVFYFELSREKGSDKLHILVCDKNGELINRDTSAIRRKEVLESALVAGFGTYNSGTEFFYWDIQGSGSSDFQYIHLMQ